MKYRIMKQIFKLCMFLLLLGVGNTVWAQIGGQFTPLQYSTHTYSIAMGDANFTPVWGVYASTVSASEIEDGVATPVAGYELVVTPYKAAGVAYFKVRFAINNVGMPTGDYVIGYKEITNDTKLCTRAVVQPITLFDAFDVDVKLPDGVPTANCPGGSEQLKGQDLTSTTTAQYIVYVNYPTAALDGYVATGGSEKWKFNFTIQISGISGTSATINSVAVAATGLTPIPSYTVPASTSVFNGTCEVKPSNVTPLTFTVVFNDQLGVSQDVSFAIKAIEGAYLEPDIDEVTGGAGNTVTHTIWSMPNVGAITALN